MRTWLLSQVRLVAAFDMPANVFAETGVNTTLLIGYKPPAGRLKRLQDDDYEVFVREIANVGYEKRTSKRNVYFKPLYRIDPLTLEVAINADGSPQLLEDFTEILNDFQEWAKSQELDLRQVFLGQGGAK